jgi:predicted O-linked N-acetylglucosamine transferase (SPINDLY family)
MDHSIILIKAMEKTGRNDPCPCGSGRKYKQCCMRTSTPPPAAIAGAQLLQLAFARHMQGHVDEARAVYRDILKREPRNAAAWHLLGVAAGDGGDHAMAIEHIARAIAIDAGNHSFHANLGRMYTLADRHADAERCYRRALALRNEPAYLDNLGNALRAQKRYEEAEASYRHAIALDAQYVNARRNLADLLQLVDRTDEALACYADALALQPDNAEIHSNIGTLLQAAGDYGPAIEYFQRALALAPDNSRAADNLVYAASIAHSPGDYIDVARKRGDALIERAQRDPRHAAFSAAMPAFPIEHATTLRVGFVSGDFRDHPVSSFLESVLPHLRNQGLDLFAYATTQQTDAVTARLQPHFNAWRSLTGVSDADAAQLVRRDRLHILVDLAGYTAGNRLGVFAWRPAPVQAAWLGFWASTGLRTIDYLLADRHSIAPGEAAHHSEQITYLPETRLCFTPPLDAGSVGPLPAATNGHVTFGCFNNPAKIGPEVIALWARILQRIPAANLHLKARRFGDATNAARMRARFAALGIAEHRIALSGESPRAGYFAAYEGIDIALDPFPFAGATTSMDGLWMGVPFITLCGDRMSARQGEAILRNASLQDWIAGDADSYVALALEKSADLHKLALLRGSLRERIRQSPLCDAARFAAHLADAFRRMWRQRVDGQMIDR